MLIYDASGKKLTPIKTRPFLEKEIQGITENYLEIILGLEFIGSEFSIGEFRIDTIAYDPEAKSFVLIEYKKDQSFSIIDQGYAYLSTMLNHKAEFVLFYNQRKGKSLGKNDFDWSQSRVIFVSPSFTVFQREAANFQDLPLELWEAHLYSNDTISYSKLIQHKSNASVKTVSKPSNIIAEVSAEIKVYTEEKLLDGVYDEIREAYFSIKDTIYQINPNVDRRIKKSMACFYSEGRGLVWVKPTKKSITLWLRKGSYKDKSGKPIPEGWGDYPELRLSHKDVDLQYVRDLIRQANEIDL